MSSFTEGKLNYQSIGKYKSGRKKYVILEPFTYIVGPYDDPYFKVDIEKGFETDFASIPWPLYYVIKPDGPWAKAACVHDKLLKKIDKYKGKRDYPYLTRLIADAVFYEAMLVSGVPRYIAWPFYIGVRVMSVIGYGIGLMNFVWKWRNKND